MTRTETFSQGGFDLRCEWGERGVVCLAPVSDVVIVVDVLSFSTCVDVATARGAAIFPYWWRDESAAAFAASVGAELAGPRSGPGYSLSPASLAEIPRGARLVLPSPNGAALALAAGGRSLLAGCLRNRSAVAAAALRHGGRVAIIPAGERWADGSLRPAVEDLVGAGAILSVLPGARSPEAKAAVAAFEHAAADLEAFLRCCGSGRELVERGFVGDVTLAAALDASDCAPELVDGAFVHARGANLI
jgi:2-phosphosulfolactate phosphatase